MLTIDSSAQTTHEAPPFSDFDVHPDIVAALADMGIVTTFPIQAMTLPVALGRHDIIGQAKTGTGKTLGFGVPLLNSVVAPGDAEYADLPAPGAPQALVVVPTRELAVQVSGDLAATAKRRGIRVLTVYGGRAYEPQVAALRDGIDVVVGTPGRLIDLAKQRHLILDKVRTVVLDEADEMLDLGFLPDVETIMSKVSPTRQTMLFSATMPGAIVALARRYMSQPTHIRAMAEDGVDSHTVAAIEHFVYRAHAMDKTELLARVLQARGRGLTIIFARTKRTAAKVADDLTERGFAAASLHGDLGQGAREQALRAFRKGKVDVLVATDVAARGIDVEHVTHVINYQCPEDEKTYVHRTGRTGRAGNTGIAVTLVDWDDLPRWGLVDKALDLGIPEPVETYSSSDHLFSDLDIPEGTTGRLPNAARTREGLDAEEVEDLGETGGRKSRSGHGDRGGRGDRDRGERGGRERGGRGGDRGSARTSERPTERTREAGSEGEGSGSTRPRSRRRTRGGQSGAGAAQQAGLGSTASTDGSGADSAGEGGAARRSRPRRRRRTGAAGGPGAVAAE
jgi:superfamily II DNA/RNA helicase